MVRIEKHDYETITATCAHCDATSVFNRIDDIGDPGPYAGRSIVCPACRRDFWITGDIVSSVFELFIWDADLQFRSKRYMLTVASLAQAWESFFAEFLYSNYLWKPFFSGDHLNREIEELNRLINELSDTLEKLSFARLRHMVMNTIIESVHPTDMAAAATGIARLRNDHFPGEPSKAAIASTADEDERAIVEGIHALRIADLRNKVVHHRAYRPRRAEVEGCLEDEVQFMYRVKHHFGIGDFFEHSAGAVWSSQEPPAG